MEATIEELKKKIENLQEENEKLKKKNQGNDKLLSLVSHDVGSYSNVLINLSQVLVELLAETGNSEAIKIAGMLRDSADNQFNLFKYLLEWTKVQEGIIPFNPMRILLESKIKVILEGLSPIAASKGITLGYLSGLDEQVVVDLFMFDAILRNLVSNGIKFTSEGGSVIVSAQRLNDKFIKICVRDTGIGMNPEIISKLFQIDTVPRRKGTKGETSNGLGLLFCKDFTERHGGKIWVESEVGKGSTFCFTIPSA